MPSPFPGMDPYLENPGLWPEIHHNFISEMQGLLTTQLRPKYLVRIEERVYIADESDETLRSELRIPDVEVLSRPGWEKARVRREAAPTREVAEPIIATTWFEEEIHEAFLKIVERKSRQVVAVIEVLSPANKVPNSPGWESFEQNRREVIHSPSHWVEIDLLRGRRMVPVPKKAGPHEYLVHVSKKGLRPQGLLYPIRLVQPLPIFSIPLKPTDPDARLDLQVVLDAAYDRGGLDMEIDYRKEPRPPLDKKVSVWADRLLRSRGLR